jgi:hypothetical protein
MVRQEGGNFQPFEGIMSKPSLTLRLLARLLCIDPETLQGEDAAPEFIAALCRRLDIRLSKRCEICGYDLDLNTWREHFSGLVSCSGLVAKAEKLRSDLERADREKDRHCEMAKRLEQERNGFQTYLKACEDDLTAAGIKTAHEAEYGHGQLPLDLRQRITLLLKHPVGERDFAWAMEQVHAGKTITHPCVTSPNDKRGYVRQTGTFTISGMQYPAYELNVGGACWSRLGADSYHWKEFCHRAQKTHGWEIVGDKPAEREAKANE